MNRKIKIRRAKPSDTNAIYWLRRKTFEKINGSDYTPEQIERLNSENTHAKVLDKMQRRDMFCLVQVANDNETLLGTVDLEGNKIGGVFVRWNCTRRGYGTKLMEFIEDYAVKKGVRRVKLYSTSYAYLFYLSLGYKQRQVRNKSVGGIKFSHREMWKTII